MNMNKCQYCGLSLKPGKYHEGHDACLQAIRDSVLASDEAGGLTILEIYGEVRYAHGKRVGRDEVAKRLKVVNKTTLPVSVQVEICEDGQMLVRVREAR